MARQIQGEETRVRHEGRRAACGIGETQGRREAERVRRPQRVSSEQIVNPLHHVFSSRAPTDLCERPTCDHVVIVVTSRTKGQRINPRRGKHPPARGAFALNSRDVGSGCRPGTRGGVDQNAA